jgi:hypothetical protein
MSAQPNYYGVQHGHVDAPDPAPASWPPSPTASASPVDEFQNTSGYGGAVPPEIARLKWNWGAFYFPQLWLLAHGMIPAGLGMILAVVAVRMAVIKFGPMFGLLNIGVIAVNIWLGVSGHKLAWQKRRYDSLQHYFAVETAWKNWALGLFLFVLVCITAAIAVGFFGAIARHAAMAHP